MDFSIISVDRRYFIVIELPFRFKWQASCQQTSIADSNAANFSRVGYFFEFEFLIRNTYVHGYVVWNG